MPDFEREDVPFGDHLDQVARRTQVGELQRTR